MRPIFLLSLPRSGSTLLQRILACHQEIATTAEPWVLLPWISPATTLVGAAEYDYHNMRAAVEDFMSHLSGGRSTYLDGVRAAASRLYQDIGGECTYFLDKTPRYHLIVDEIVETFPEARIILLWRNPLAVAASMMETWSQGKWNLHRFEIDLYQGIDNLLRAREKHGVRIFEIRFEDLVSDPEPRFHDILGYLGLEANPKIINDFSRIDVSGRMGDPTGVKNYKTLNKQAADKWTTSFSNPIRKQWARRYLEWLGEKRLHTMGYDLRSLRMTVDHIPTTFQHMTSDMARLLYLPVYRLLRRACLSVDRL